jgi:protoporphyrinogen oxidase
MSDGTSNGNGRGDAIDQLVSELVARLPLEPAATDPEESMGTAILGAGPAGLSAAYVLAGHCAPGIVFEADGTVGGISKTGVYKGYRFDLGGHRFFTKLKPIEELWRQTLNGDFLTRPRLSRIYYNSRFLAYPLQARDVVRRLGLVESALCALSYLCQAWRRHENAETFEEWVTIRFGKRLYNAFFKSYSEKVWGIPGSEIRSLWAAQRIKNFSLGKAILSILGLGREHVTTLIEEFKYPRFGPGQMWETFARNLERSGIPIRLKERCESIRHRDGRVESVVIRTNGSVYEYAVDAVLSSIPLQELIFSLDPPPPPEVLEAAHRLRYRDLCLVALMTTEAEPFPDNWIYLHDPETRAGRVQNYGAWSADMVQPGTTCLGVEYFCFRGDDIWTMSDEEAVALAKEELARIGLIDPDQVFDGVKVLVPNAYPMYDSTYEEAVDVLRVYLEGFANLKTFGRNGLHRYNNQDHSMWTGILSALNLVTGTNHDVWSVNTDSDYLEEAAASAEALGIELSEPAPSEETAPAIVLGSPARAAN